MQNVSLTYLRGLEVAELKEEAKTGDDTDYPLFVDTREDALKLLQMTENGEEQVGGEIVFE